jgi:hypothetical protein
VPLGPRASTTCSQGRRAARADWMGDRSSWAPTVAVSRPGPRLRRHRRHVDAPNASTSGSTGARWGPSGVRLTSCGSRITEQVGSTHNRAHERHANYGQATIAQCSPARGQPIASRHTNNAAPTHSASQSCADSPVCAHTPTGASMDGARQTRPCPQSPCPLRGPPSIVQGAPGSFGRVEAD